MHRQIPRAWILGRILSLAFLLQLSSARAEDFFKGKTVHIVVGTTPGGFYDNVGRVIARHIIDYLPGHPTVVVENMPGASGLQVANYLAAGAPKDGTVLSVFNKSLPLYEILGTPGVRFASKRLSWIGAVSQTQDVVVVWHTSGIQTIDDAKKRDSVFGAVSVVGTTFTYPAVLNAFLGTRFKIVTGYAGGLAVDHGMEQGEIEGRGSNQWSTWKAEHPSWVSEKKIIPLVQIGLHKEPDLPEVPTLLELAKTPEQKDVFNLLSDGAAFDGPLAAPPHLPPEILKTLRDAFDRMGADPEFIKDANGLGLEPSPLSGSRVAEIIDRLMSAPKSTITAVQNAVASQSQ